MFRNNFNILRNVGNTGFGDNPETESWEIFDENGNPNVRKTGLTSNMRFSLYHYLISISWRQLFFVILVYYVTINILFAIVYYLLGFVETGLASQAGISRFWNCFFFSTHTLTTVGYGNIHPIGFWTNIVASFEMFWGLLNFAVMSGLMYGKFISPKAYIKFSDKVLVETDENDELQSLMFRLVPYKNKAVFSDAKINILVMYKEIVDGKSRYRFYPMKPEMSEIKSLALNWTVVHRVDGDSPLLNFKKDTVLSDEYQLIIYFSAYDELYANNVKKRHVYYARDVEFNKVFETMYFPANHETVLELDKLNNTLDQKLS